MKMSMTVQSKGHLWLVFTMLFVTFAMHGERASSFAPPSPVIKVIGKVYCYRCFNEAQPEESHGKKHLEGAMVKVTCQANDQALVAFGYTRNNGKYSVIIKGLPISNTYGADSCKVELHGAPGGSDCNVPIELNLSGLSVYSKSSEEVVLQANQIMAFASKNTLECSKPHMPPPAHPYNSPQLPYRYPSPPASHKSQPLPPPATHPYNSPQLPYQYPSAPASHKSQPLPYQHSPPPSNLFPPPAYQYPSPPLNNYASPPPYLQSTLPNSYQSPPPLQGANSPVPSHKYLPPPYYYNSPPPQYQYNYLPPPLANQYPPPPYIHNLPLLPSPTATTYQHNSPPPYQYAPPPFSHQYSPPPAQYSPQLPPNAPNHLHPSVPHAKSPPVSSASPQPLYQHNSPPPPSEALPVTMPPLHSYQSPPPTNHAPNHLQPSVPHAKSPPVSSASPQPLYQHNSPPTPSEALPVTMPPLRSYQSPLPTNQLS